MTKRNLIVEIREKNARASGRYLHGNLELYELEGSFRRLKEADATLRSLHVMGLASCIEVAVREAIKRLVNAGDPYLQQAELFKDIRFDFALTQALSAGLITFGDLVSHSLPVSQLTQIAYHFQILFGVEQNKGGFKALLEGVREYAEPSEEELFGEAEPGRTQQTAPLLLKDVDSLLHDVAMTFEIRHLVAHEANFAAVFHDDLARLMQNCRQFLDALYELVEQALNPGASRSGYGGSLQAMANAGGIATQADDVTLRIAAKIPSVPSSTLDLSALFQQSVDAFNAYYDAEESLRLAMHGLLTGNAMRNIESHVRALLYRQRLDYLTDLEESVDFYSETAP